MKNKPRKIGSQATHYKPELPKESKATVQNLVYHELRRALMTGAFMPGSKVTLRGLTQQLGTSIMPVRESVNRLIAERALQVAGTRQVIVPVMTEEKFAEITYWRVRLEADATRAASRYITPLAIARIEAINAEMSVAVDEDRRDALLPLNYQFHFAIYAAARSEILLPMIESLWLQAGPFTYFSTPSPKALWNAKHHRDIIRALKARDGDAAAQALVRDIENSATYLKSSGHFVRPPVRPVTGWSGRRNPASARVSDSTVPH